MLLACERGQLSSVKHLVKYGAFVKDSQMINESTPLHMAANNGHLDIIQYLVSLGANINEIDSYGNYVFQIACEFGYFEIVEYLVKYGCDINGKNGDYLIIMMDFLLFI